MGRSAQIKALSTPIGMQSQHLGTQGCMVEGPVAQHLAQGVGRFQQGMVSSLVGMAMNQVAAVGGF